MSEGLYNQRGRAMVDPEVWGRRVRPHTDWDQSPHYDSDEALFPPGWDAMDEDRHRVDCWFDSEPRQRDGRWEWVCLGCSHIATATSRGEVVRLAAAHEGPDFPAEWLENVG